MKQLRIFMWLKAKETGIGLLGIGAAYIFISTTVCGMYLYDLFYVGRVAWPILEAVKYTWPGGVLGCCGIIWLFIYWLHSNWKKAGEIAKEQNGR